MIAIAKIGIDPIPIISNNVEIIPANKSHYKVIPTNNKEELIKAIRSFKNVDRKEIQEMTFEKHSKKNWKKNFENAIDKTIGNFKNVRTVL